MTDGEARFSSKMENDTSATHCRRVFEEACQSTGVILTLSLLPELNDTSAPGLYLLQSYRIKLIVS